MHGASLTQTLAQLIVIIVAARVAGAFAGRLSQPRVIGEILAGLLLGPSLLGLLMPDVFAGIFNPAATVQLSLLSEIGLILFMFQIGIELDFGHIREAATRRATLTVAVAGIIVPMVFGIGLGLLSAREIAGIADAIGYSLFIGVAFTITAVPVLGRILMEFNLTRTRVGIVAMTAAAITDAVGWLLLAAVTALVAGNFSIVDTMLRGGALLVFLGVMWWLVRPLISHMILRAAPVRDELSASLIAVMLIVIFTSGMVTSSIGIFAPFGAFAAGVIMHDRRAFVAAWTKHLSAFVLVLFLPIYFTHTGLRTDAGMLNTASQWTWFAIMLAGATAGKLGACYLAARASKLTNTEAWSVGFMMNTRGLMELVVLNIGYDLGVIPREVFTMLVLVAIISTIVTAPALQRLLPRMGHVVTARKDI